jgi:prepilin-type N-terminal cleavage/methylation domain-containing protein
MKLRKMIRLVKRIQIKIHNRKGFTLAEILLAILIMLMVS